MPAIYDHGIERFELSEPSIIPVTLIDCRTNARIEPSTRLWSEDGIHRRAVSLSLCGCDDAEVSRFQCHRVLNLDGSFNVTFDPIPASPGLKPTQEHETWDSRDTQEGEREPTQLKPRGPIYSLSGWVDNSETASIASLPQVGEHCDL